MQKIASSVHEAEYQKILLQEISQKSAQLLMTPVFDNTSHLLNSEDPPHM